MKTSEEGIRLNKSFEGYHKKLANGDCTAYCTYLGGGKYDIPTIGYGTVKGVQMGMVLTEAEATERMMQDLAEAESYVTRYVTVTINQNQFDALTLFCNNCGPGNLKKLVEPLNRGDATGTAKKFALYVKAQGRTLPGLVSRRAREQALFLKPVEAPAEPYMPQTVQKANEPLPAPAVATGTAATGGFIYTVWQTVSDKVNSFLDSFNDPQQVLGLVGTAQKQGISFPVSSVLLYAGLGVGLYVLVGHVLPKLIGRDA